MESIHYSAVDYEAVQRLSQAKLQRLGFEWDDVEEIIPVTFPAMRMFLKDLPNPNTRILSYSLGDLARLETAVRGTLQSWQLLRSIAVDTGDESLVLLILRYDDKYLKKAVVHWPTINNKRQLQNMRLTGDHWKGELPRGLLCTMAIGKISDTGACALAYTVNHAVVDRLASRNIYADITALLSGGMTCKKVDWSFFSNIYRCYGTSVPAGEAVVSNLTRLQGIGAFHASIWPRVDGIAAQSSCTANARNTQTLEAVEATNGSTIHYAQTRRLPNLQTCRKEFAVRPAIVTKAAIALYNCRVTGTFTALIAVVLSGRSWPFLDDSIARFLPDPKHIAGPTTSMCTDVIKLDPREAVGQMLERIDQEQRLMTRYQHCPLTVLGHLHDEDRRVWARARKQIFNWLPFDHSQNINLEVGKPVLELVSDKASKVDEEVDEFTWRCEMIDDERLKIQIYAGATMFDMSALESVAEQVFDIVEVLSDVRKWDQEIGKIVSFRQKPVDR